MIVTVVRFNDRKEFLYDAEVFKRYDTKTALQIHEEYTRRHSANPAPRFLEIDRAQTNIDPLWHMPLQARTQFSRELLMPAINFFDKPSWRLTKAGITPKRVDKFCLSNNVLQTLDYFPERGDLVDWNGYRYLIEKVEMKPEAYWQQTNVWLGLTVECIIPPDGDAGPLTNAREVAPSEASPTMETVKAGPTPPFVPGKVGKQGL